MALVRKHALSGGAIDKLATAEAYENMIVTAVRTGGGTLKLIVWQVVGDQLQRKGEAAGGAVTDVFASPAGYARIATACRDTSGNLTLSTWDVSPDGQIQRVDTASAGAIGMAAPVGLTPSMMATPVTDSAGNLKVIAWAIAADGQLTRCGDASAGATSLVASDRWSEGRFVTAVRNGQGNLELIHWIVWPTGQVERLGGAEAGATGDLDLIRNHEMYSVDGQEFFTAVKDGTGKIKLIAWMATAEGPIERLGDLVATPGSKLALGHVGFTRHAVAFRDAAGNLAITTFSWGWMSDPSNPKVPTHKGFEVLEEAAAGATSLTGAGGTTTSGQFVTPVRAGDGALKMILWKLE